MDDDYLCRLYQSSKASVWDHGHEHHLVRGPVRASCNTCEGMGIPEYLLRREEVWRTCWNATAAAGSGPFPRGSTPRRPGSIWKPRLGTPAAWCSRTSGTGTLPGPDTSSTATETRTRAYPSSQLERARRIFPPGRPARGVRAGPRGRSRRHTSCDRGLRPACHTRPPTGFCAACVDHVGEGVGG
ncbi:endonuclease domain-containing protein [Streptomyces tanashiensis]|uniref:endonuclease domain-containing protein n=1 Tax=Streptomyces tanashiensis TaxID=67367 RepID=UPI00167E4D4A